ncbi:MAG: PAS domain-containing protein [Candidatus Aegiribacteria sp.]|nr:PAS domain-containing protein [Candidatus Aegiribacteria sp.]
MRITTNSQQPGKESDKSLKKLKGKTLSEKNPHSFGILSIVTLAIIVIIAFLWLNEILDIPYYILGAPQTPVNLSEAAIETIFILGFGIFILLLLKSSIDKKKRAEQERLATVANTVKSMDAGLLMLDRNGRVFFINQTFINMVGYEMSELLGKEMIEMGKKLSIPDDRSLAFEVIKTAISCEVPKPVPITIKSRDGKVITVLFGVSFINDSEGNTEKTILTLIDISDLKHTQEELVNTSSYLENLIYYANAPIIVWDPNFIITRFNHAFELLAGRKSDKVIGQKLSILFPEESRNDSMKKIGSTLRGRFWEAVDIPILHSDGSVKFVIWNSANIYEDDGVNIKATIAQGHDTTSRKKTEKALRDSEKWSHLLLRTMPCGLFTVDLNRRITSWNEVAEDITGLNKREVIGKYCLEALNCDTCKEECVLFSKTVDKPVYRKECTVHLNGRDIILSKNIDVLRDSNGKIIGGLESFNDITEYKHLEDKFKQNGAGSDI